jgi:MHS family proline/betaine transporter-like MFS transporter
MTQTPDQVRSSAPNLNSTRRRTLALAAVGNVFEWYDFTVYGFLAPYIAAVFFPSVDPIAALLSTFVIFFVGFLARPIGALIFGSLSDRVGRKPVMLISMSLMAAGALIIGLAPGYAVAGSLGTVIVVLGRLIQGLSAGGEQGASGIFLVEWAGPKQRGFFGSFLNSAATTGVLLGALLTAALTSALGVDAMSGWGWRIPFFVGAVLALVVLFARRKVDETPVFREMQAAHEKVEAGAVAVEGGLRTRISNRKAFFIAFGLIALWATTTGIALTYMPTFAYSIVGVDGSGALWATVLGAALTAGLIPVGGLVSDRVGRRPLFLFTAIGYLVLTVPLFALIVTTKEFWSVLLFEFVMSFFSAAIGGAAIATIVELFSGRRRGFMVTMTLALGVTIFGGLATYACTWLISVTGQPIAVVYWVMGLALITLVAALFLPRDLHRRELGK